MDEPKSNGFSVASMACGIAGVICTGVLGIELAIVSLVMRSIYRNKNGGRDNSETQAGYVTSIIALVACAVEILIVIAVFVLIAFVGVAGILSAVGA